jgi:hypothetical protein
VKDFAQYHALARKVVADARYSGSAFSYGDWRISQCAAETVSSGNLGTWVGIDMNHHLALTLSQMEHVTQAISARAGEPAFEDIPL